MSKTLAVLAAILSPLATSGVSASSPPHNLFFVETFDDEKTVFESGKWIKSLKEKYQNQPVLIKPAINSPPELLGDKGIELTEEMKFYGFGSKFSSPLIINGKDLVVQYEFKADSFQCGGAYVKLPQAAVLSNFEELDNDTPYTIMFGPDRCGSTNKVHFILQHQNPLTKKWEEKHFIDAPAAKTDANTHLYTLHLRKDNSFAIYIDKKLEKEGNLLTSMQPSVNPPKMIDDPTDKKPADWVEEAKIPDPAATKPEDWDETQPATIIDTEAVKPAGWLDDVEPTIDDPEAEKPSDWDDEEDGEWEAPQIPNPLCTVGCGPWSAPRVRNPLYKGKWTPPYIDNPLYKGEWKPLQIPNPNYYEDLRPADVAPIGGVAIEVWTTNSGFHFDNFAIGYNLDDAFHFADETFTLKVKAEEEQNEKESAEQRKQAREQKLAEGGFVNTFQVYVAEAFELLGEQPPAALIAAVVLILLSIYFFIPSSSSSSSSSSSKSNTASNSTESENASASSSAAASSSAPAAASSSSSQAEQSSKKQDKGKKIVELDEEDETVEGDGEEEEEEEEEVSSSKGKKRTKKVD